MPVYLVHGFRWPRDGFLGIRVHAIVNNLDDLSVEYIQNGNSRRDLIRSLRKAHPEIMQELDHSDIDNETYVQPGVGGVRHGERRLEFIEQYNPDDVEGPNAVSQPYAYVGDKVVVIAASPGIVASAERQAAAGSQSPTLGQRKPRPVTKPMSKAQPFNSPANITALSVNVEEVIADGPGLTNKAWEALADLRDKIAEGEKIGWWVVFNGDPDRGFDDLSDEDEEMEDDDDDEEEEEEEEEEDEDEMQVVEADGGNRRNLPSPGSTGTAFKPAFNAAPSAAPTLTARSKQQYPPSHPPQPQRKGSSPGLTALPIRPSPPSTQAPSRTQTQNPHSRNNMSSSTNSSGSSPVETRTSNSRSKDVPDDTGKVRDNAKSQGLRKKFFGRRT